MISRCRCELCVCVCVCVCISICMLYADVHNAKNNSSYPSLYKI